MGRMQTGLETNVCNRIPTFRQECAKGGSVLIWLCLHFSELSLAIIFVCFPIWASANKAHPIQEKGKTPAGFVNAVTGPVLSKHVIVNNISVEKEDFSRWATLHYDLRTDPPRPFIFRAVNVEVPVGRQEPIVGSEERFIVLGWNRKLVSIEQEGLRKATRYKFGWRSAFIGNPEKVIVAPRRRFILYGRYDKPRALRIENSLRVQESGFSGIFRSLRLPLHDVSLTVNSLDAIGGSFGRLGGFYRLVPNFEKSTNRYDDSGNARESQENSTDQCNVIWWDAHDPYSPLILAAFDSSAMLIGGVLGGIFVCAWSGRYRRLGHVFIGLGFLLCVIGSLLAGWGWAWGTYEQGECSNEQAYPHNAIIVPHKYLLTRANCWGTVIGIGRADTPNVLSTDKQVAVISALAEGSGIRQIERITGVHRDTIMRLGVRVGTGCANVLDRKMRDLSCNHLQFDEIWGFIGKKERHCTPDDSPEVGDVWTFCAIDSDTKIVPSFRVGKRDNATANAFVADVASRMANRVQISTDGLRSYIEAVEQAFGSNVDYAQIVKIFEDESMDAEVIGMDKTAFSGRPDMSLASTSHIERLNGTTRLHMRRLTRLTYAFSKKRENFEAAVGLHFAYYNFVKRHNTLRMTPAMAAGIERDFWTVCDLVEATA